MATNNERRVYMLCGHHIRQILFIVSVNCNRYFIASLDFSCQVIVIGVCVCAKKQKKIERKREKEKGADEEKGHKQ